ncbi:MAG: hypothetical protein EXS16_01835 [Gemmataceae bacterium]|nr:hypothetical protein [Gemmataceae bacterium]
MPIVRCPECGEKVKLPADDRKVVRCASCRHKFRLDDEDDAQTVSEKPPAKKKRSANNGEAGPPRRRSRADDDDEDQPSPKKQRPNKTWKGLTKVLDRMSTPVKVGVGIALVVLLLACIHPFSFLLVLIAYTMIIVLTGSVMYIVVIARDDMVELLKCIFIPFYGLYYLFTHWDNLKHAVYTQLFGLFVPALLGFFPLPCYWVVYGTGKSEAPIEIPPTAKLTGDATLDRILARLVYTDPRGGPRGVLMELASMNIDNTHRPVVAKKLAEFLQTADRTDRAETIRVLTRWATPAEIPVLIPILQDKEITNRIVVLRGIGRLQDKRSVIPVLECLSVAGLESEVVPTLINIGPVAEPELLGLLKGEDNALRISALRVLEHSGTPACYPALEALTANQDQTTRTRAKIAIDGITARNKK